MVPVRRALSVLRSLGVAHCSLRLRHVFFEPPGNEEGDRGRVFLGDFQHCVEAERPLLDSASFSRAPPLPSGGEQDERDLLRLEEDLNDLFALRSQIDSLMSTRGATHNYNDEGSL
jgi:hypothetical protein